MRSRVSWLRFVLFAAVLLPLSARAQELPDLVIDSIDASALMRDADSGVVSGTISFVIRNDSRTAATAAPSLLFFEDKDRDGSYSPVTDTLLGEVTLSPIGALSTATGSAEIGGQLTFAAAPITGLIDAHQAVREENESNNTGTSSAPGHAFPCDAPPFDPDTIVLRNVLPDVDFKPNQTVLVGHFEDANGDGKYDEKDPPTIVTSGSHYEGPIFTLRGTDGALLDLYCVDCADVPVAPWEGYAIGNLDSDLEPELVTVGSVPGGSGIIILDQHLRAQSVGSPISASLEEGYPLIANLDGRGAPEIVLGNRVLSNTGRLITSAPSFPRGGCGLITYDTNRAQPAVADIDLDGDLELILGGAVYSFDGHALHLERQASDYEGWSAVADLDGDEDHHAELILASNDAVRMYTVPALDADGTGTLELAWTWHSSDAWPWDTSYSCPSAPALKDLDGDGLPEILIAAGHRFGALSAATGLSDSARIIWQYDAGCGVDPLTAFDLDGDGTPEIIEQDNLKFRILSASGTVLFEEDRETESGFLKGPTVADVDADGHADILMGTRGDTGGSTKGLWIYSSPDWMPARSTWNELPYAGTNVNDDQSIPRHPLPNWLSPAGAPFNDYRCQHAPNSAAACSALPDLSVSHVTSDDDACGSPTDLHAVIGNGGGSPSPDGISVTFYAGDPAWDNPIGSTTVDALAPSQSVTVDMSSGDVFVGEAYVVVDEENVLAEADEDNNIAHARVSAGCDPTPSRHDVVLTLDTPSSATYHEPLELSATLTDEAPDPDVPVPGVFVDFSFGTNTCRALTNEDGVASCWVTPQDDAGTVHLSATSDETSRWASDSDGPDDVTLELAPTTLAFEMPTIQVDSLGVGARLLENGSRPLSSRTITFTETSASDHGDTNSGGHATGALDLHVPGTYSISASASSTATHAAASVGPLSVTLLAPQIAVAEPVAHVDGGSDVAITAIVLDDGRELLDLPIAFARQSGSHSTDTGTGNPGTTDTDGRATWTYEAAATAGTDVVHAWIDFDEDGFEDTGEPVAEETVIIGRNVTSLSFVVWPLEGDFDDAISITAKLMAGEELLEGEVVTIGMGDESCRAITDEIGHAVCWLTPKDDDLTVTAVFAGSPDHAPMEFSDDFNILPEQTELVGEITTGGTLHAWLLEDSAKPIEGAQIHIVDGSSNYYPETDEDGYATYSGLSSSATVTFDGDDLYDSSILALPRWWGRGSSPYSTAVPDHPTSVGASVLGDNAIEVTFTAGTNTSTKPPTEGFLVTVDGDVRGTLNSYELVSGVGTVDVSGVASSAEEHDVAVIAVGFASGSSKGESNPADAATTILVNAIPSAPTDVALNAGSTPNVEWSAPDSDGGDDDIAYTVSCTQSGTPIADATSPQDVDDLDAGPNTCWVRAENGEGAGPWAPSDPTIGGEAPSEPLDLLHDEGNGVVTLYWTQPADLNGSAIGHYVVTMDSTALTPNVDGDTVKLVVDGLTNGASHDFTVQACNGSACGDEAEASATPRGAPGAPADVAATNDHGTLVVTWTNPSSNGGSALLGHLAKGGDARSTATGAATAAPLTELPLGIAVLPEVDAVNARGSSDATRAEDEVTPAREPEKPTDVEVSANTDGTVRITWRAPATEDDGGSAITGYVITTIPDSGEHPDTGTALDEMIDGLPLGIPHVAFVRAINGIGTGAESDVSNDFTPHARPSAPRGLTMSVAGDTKLLATWAAPESDGGESLGDFTLEGTSTSCATVTASPPPPGGSRRRVLTAADGLVAGCTYTFTITASNTAGAGDPDAADAITVAMLPGAPTLSDDPDEADGQLTVSWSALSSGAPRGYADILSYRACPLPGDAPCVDVSGSATSATVGDLTNGTAYRIEVRARNVVGLGAASITDEAALPCGPPAPPAWVTAQQEGEEAIRVAWAEGYDGGCGPITYAVHVDDGGAGWDLTGITETDVLVDSGLTACDAYSFTVTAENARALSSGPSVSSNTIHAALKPEPPDDVEILSGDTCAVVRWSDPSDVHCANVTGYRITLSGKPPVDVAVGAHCILIPELANDTTYDVEVITLSDAGDSDNATPSEDVTPEVPTVESVEILGDPDPPDTGDDAVEAGARATLVVQLSGVASPEGTDIHVVNDDPTIAEAVLEEHYTYCGEARILVPIQTYLLGGTATFEVSIGSGTPMTDDLVVGGASGSAECSAHLDSPDDGSEVTDYGTEVWGSAEWDGTGGSWELELCPATQEFDDDVPCTSLTPLADDASPQRHELLAKIDPTLLLNGEYALNLISHPPTGDPCIATRSITVSGQQKVGAFRLSFVDMTIPVAGMPIQVIRSYDSIDPRDGDFGVGWRLSFSDVRVESALPTYTDWAMHVQGFAPFYQECYEETRAHQVSVIFPDGKTYRFKPVISRVRGAVVPCGVGEPEEFYLDYVPIGSTRATLVPIDPDDGDHVHPFDGQDVNAISFLPGEGIIFWQDGDLDFSSDEPYDPQDFELTTEDGTKWRITKGVGLRSVEDRNGNKLTFDSGGITSSSGPAVTIARSGGLVSSITDPRGNATHYCYDSYSGRAKLWRYCDRTAGSVSAYCAADHWTEFGYTMTGHPYLVTDISQQTPGTPSTTPPPYMRSEYDEDGRLERTCQIIGSTEHGCVEMAVDSTDLGDHQQQVTDLRGASITYHYDERGRVTLKHDADGDWATEGYTDDDQPIKELTPRTDGSDNAFTQNEYDAQGNVLTVSNFLGDVASYTWGPQHRLDTMTLPGLPPTHYAYDFRNNLETVTDALGHETYTHHDSHGNADLRRDALLHESTTAFESGQNWVETDATGALTTYEHDANGNTTSVTRSDGTRPFTTTTDYDAQDRVIRTTGAEGSVHETVYDDFGRVHVERELASKGLDEEDPDDDTWRETTNVYDDYGNLQYVLHDVVTGSTRTPLTYEEYAYDENHNRIMERSTTKYAGWNSSSGEPDPADPPDVNVVMLHEYDAKNRLIKTCRQGSDGIDMEDADWDLGCTTTHRDVETGITWHRDERGAFTVTEEDMAGRAHVRCGPFFLDPPDDADPEELDCDGRPLRTVTEYDDAGRASTTTDPLGYVTQSLYDDAGRRYAECRYNGADPPSSIPDTKAEAVATQSDSITDPEIVCTVWDHDALGQVIAEHDRNGKTTQYGHDAVGRLTSVTDARGKITQYGFDDAGNMTSQTDANEHVTTYEFDGEGRRTARELPLHQRETFHYGIAGELQSRIDFAGKAIVHFDADLDGSEDERSFVNDDPVSFTYWGDGQRHVVTDNRGDTTYDRDLESGRLTSVEKPLGTSHEVTLSYTWDEAGNRTSTTTEVVTGSGTDTHVTNYTFNAAGQLASVSDDRGSVDYEYDDDGRLVTESYQSGAVIGTWVYDDLTGGVRSLTWMAGTSLLWGVEYTLEKMGRRTAALETRDDASTREVTWTFDDDYRLTDEVVTGGQELHWEYDDVGNRMLETRTEPTSSSMDYSYDANDRMEHAGTDDCGWDPNGNMTDKGTTHYDWDDQDRLHAIPTDGWSFAYDADGLKQSSSGAEDYDQVVDGTFAYVQVLEDRAPLDGAPTRRYTRGPFPVRIDIEGSDGGSWWYLHDALGTTRALIRIDGTLGAETTDRVDLEAFGSVSSLWTHGSDSCGARNRWLQNGEESPLAGLTYLRARWLETKQGDFTSRDPHDGAPLAPESRQPYHFGYMDPLHQIDPSGNDSIDSMALVALVLPGGATGAATAGTKTPTQKLVLTMTFSRPRAVKYVQNALRASSPVLGIVPSPQNQTAMQYASLDPNPVFLPWQHRYGATINGRSYIYPPAFENLLDQSTHAMELVHTVAHESYHNFYYPRPFCRNESNADIMGEVAVYWWVNFADADPSVQAIAP